MDISRRECQGLYVNLGVGISFARFTWIVCLYVWIEDDDDDDDDDNILIAFSNMAKWYLPLPMSNMIQSQISLIRSFQSH